MRGAPFPVNDTVILGIIVGLPPTIAACTAAFVAFSTRAKTSAIQENVAKIERQTNSMNSQMTDSARKEGRQEGKEHAEQVAAAVTAAAAPVVMPAPLPLVIAPDVKQEDIVKWVAQGYAQGILYEKARRATEGNGPKT